jgi:hypothetical protein
MANKIKLVFVFSRPSYEIHSAYIGVSLGKISGAVVVGVPPYRNSLSVITKNPEPLCEAWYNDSSDYQGLTKKQREKLLTAACDDAWRLLQESGGEY